MQPKDRLDSDGQLSFLKSAGMHLQVDKCPMISWESEMCQRSLQNGQQWSQSDEEWVAEVGQEEEEHSGQRI